ncbi:hypothetical protein HHX48_08735 [Salinimonas sp. HHU 13199]|uniref:Uncharacterized protein n=1 Tax=Salinimonas profundi TaxID=2729140 RepID=A0ABR8LJR9_9ALTE|nr:hypothetical protein [Salinimonas profundi]MBD3585818.1 hypothetical protein [Salinimonas profundi]
MTNKKAVQILTTIVAALLTGHFFLAEPKDAPERLSRAATKVQAATAANDTVITINPLNLAEQNNNTVSLNDTVNSKQWCKAERNLTEQQRITHRKAALEWDASRGNILIPDYRSAFESKNSNLIAPYVGMQLDKVIRHAQNDDEFALLTLLQRKDAPKKAKDRSAHRLMVLGNTSLALSHLVMKELYLAKYEFAKEGTVSDAVKSHLLNSLAYVSYGIERLDASALRAYVIGTQPKNLNRDFNPDEALDEISSANITDRKNHLIDYINAERLQIHLEPVGNSHIPKIAQREFDISVAILYANFASQIGESESLSKVSVYDFSRKSDCVSEYISKLTQSDSASVQ